MAKFSIDTSRHNVTDSDIVVSHILHHGFTKAIEPKLGGIISRAAFKWILSSETTNVDDIASTGFLHVGDDFMAAVENSCQIGIDDFSPLLRNHFADIDEMSHTGVIDENRDLAKSIHSKFYQLDDLLILADITRNSGNLPRVQRFNPAKV